MDAITLWSDLSIYTCLKAVYYLPLTKREHNPKELKYFRNANMNNLYKFEGEYCYILCPHEYDRSSCGIVA